jgi:hypothetical protein
MMQKKAVLSAASVLLVLLVLVGFFAIAAEVGGREDPLVSLSYLQALEPDLKNKIDELVQERMAEYDKSIQDAIAAALAELDSYTPGTSSGPSASDPAFIAQVADRVAEIIGGQSSAPSDVLPSTYTRVTIPAGKTVLFGEGTSFFKRTGTATVYREAQTTSAGLINLSTGRELNTGEVPNNYLFSVTFDNSRGFKTTTEVIIFVLGPYIIK